jgi:uncharacterized protein
MQTRSPKSIELAQRFHLEPSTLHSHANHTSPASSAPPLPGRILFITGPSGSGKSSMLRAMLPQLQGQVFDLAAVELPDESNPLSVIDCLTSDVPDAIRLLALVGLAEVHLCFLHPQHLSEGQRWRLKLAVVLERVLARQAASVVVCDEFCSFLDRLTAAVVCRSLRKFVTTHADRLSCVVVSSHDQLQHALAPDHTVRCDFEPATG